MDGGQEKHAADKYKRIKKGFLGFEKDLHMIGNLLIWQRKAEISKQRVQFIESSEMWESGVNGEKPNRVAKREGDS